MAAIRRPSRPLSADVSAHTEYTRALENYCTLLEGAGRTIEQQNGRMAGALMWYADRDHYDLFGVPGEQLNGEYLPDRGGRAATIMAELAERNTGVHDER